MNNKGILTTALCLSVMTSTMAQSITGKVVDTKGEPLAFANVVLYSKDTLAKKNEGDTQPDWEVVAVLASSVENEPMDPITMMRNMRGKAGGTRVNYTAEQLLDSIEYWSTHAKAESAI